MIQQPDRILLNARRHLVKHIKTCHLVLDKRISLSVGLQSDTLTKLIHIIDVIHPLAVDHLQENDALKLTELLRLRELRLLRLIQLHCTLL